MFDTDLTSLDVDATLAFAAEARGLADHAETRLIEAAAHFADLHGHLDTLTESSGPLPGLERLVELGGSGTPAVAEFAAAELGAELQISPSAAGRLIGDALDLRHRLPRLWGRVLAGQVKPWIGRRTAETTRHLSVEVVAAVDAKITPWAHSLSWGRLDTILKAAVIRADPEAAATAAEAAAKAQRVWVKQSNHHGIKDIYIRTEAPNAIWFDASIQRIADSLKAFGDTSSQDVRRGRAVGVLAQPQQALDLYDQTTALMTDPAKSSQGNPASDEAAEPETTTDRLTVNADPRPPATLYIHLNQDSFTRDDAGVARFEGVGPVTVDQARRFLSHCHVNIRPVIDLDHMTPVDSYEIPDHVRDAAHLRSPVDVFPYATNTSRRRDLDHTDAYQHPDGGGPPGQTRLDNLGPMTRFHHRIKTHGRWQVRQPFNGVFVWRSPSGRIFTVDATGTTKAA